MQFMNNSTMGSEMSKHPLIYILMYEGQVINVYREYTDAIKAAIEDVTIDPNNTFIDNFDTVIYVGGCKGEIAILVEQLR